MQSYIHILWFVIEKLMAKRQNKTILHLITGTDYLFLLKKINCFRFCNLRIRLIIKFGDFDINVMVLII